MIEHRTGTNGSHGGSAGAAAAAPDAAGAGYLDHAATSFPKAPGVVEAMARLLREAAGNPGRGGHRLTLTASRVVETCRERVADLLGGHPERTLLGPGATFWLSTVLASVARPGSRIVTSSLEHNAVMRPLRHLERTRGVRVDQVEAAAATGVPTADEVAARVAEAETAAVVMTHASNVSGAVVDVATIARAIAPVPLVVDGAQSAGSLPFDLEASGVAAFACSGHKGLLGPTGVGVLLLAEGFEVEPLVRGGTGSRSESLEMPELLPDRLEAGTPPTAAIAGLGAACAWLDRHGVEQVHRHQLELLRRAAAGLAGLPGVVLHGLSGEPGTDPAPGGAHVGTLSFSVTGMDPGELALRLDRQHGLMLRVGLHCAPTAHRRLGTFPDGTLRASFGPFAEAAVIDRLVAAVRSEFAR
jgi:selenocysteine lyase/cysteine desulfurase